ncbi:MAG: hypothetical protein JO203_15525 [Gammaproteobacteria bacterium]|nr:hypothetical protein [Gammaproteobacteria bacterium]
MNEIQLIRTQLALERGHATAVANACATVLQADGGAGPTSDSLGQFRRACVDYLACVLAWFEERDQRLADLIQGRFGAADPTRRAFEEALARRGRSRDALAQLEAACADSVAGASAPRQQRWREFGEYFNGVWSTRREALEALLASNTRAGDWRMLGGIDADSILEERRRYALVAAQAPPGVTLGTATER